MGVNAIAVDNVISLSAHPRFCLPLAPKSLWTHLSTHMHPHTLSALFKHCAPSGNAKLVLDMLSYILTSLLKIDLVHKQSLSLVLHLHVRTGSETIPLSLMATK